MAKSGGAGSRNTREGFRSETIAQFVFTAFGTAVPVTQHEDLGIDLVCNLTSYEGLYIYFQSSYGVQVKSTGTEFKYSGTQATTWLSKLEYPLLLAEIDKAQMIVKIYSTWNINRFLLNLHTNDETHFPQEITFPLGGSWEHGLPTPDTSNGKIYVGEPILYFKVDELGDDNKLNGFRNIISNWLDTDNKNYALRRAGISAALGYIKWETNSLNNLIWGKSFHFSQFHEALTKTTLSEAMICLGLLQKSFYEQSKDVVFRNQFNKIRDFSNSILGGNLPQFGTDLFRDELR